jgi:thiol-disulfide isomerase/thioredoxin
MWLLALLLLAACGGERSNLPPGVGARLPMVVLEGLGEEAPVSMDAMRGVPLIINFWATWCAPCRSEMTSLQRLSHRLAGHGVRVIGVTVDPDVNLAREFIRSHALTFPMYLDGRGKSLQWTLRVRALPETILVARDGRIAARIVGARDWESAESARVLEWALGVRPGAEH